MHEEFPRIAIVEGMGQCFKRFMGINEDCFPPAAMPSSSFHLEALFVQEHILLVTLPEHPVDKGDKKLALLVQCRNKP